MRKMANDMSAFPLMYTIGKHRGELPTSRYVLGRAFRSRASTSLVMTCFARTLTAPSLSIRYISDLFALCIPSTSRVCSPVVQDSRLGIALFVIDVPTEGLEKLTDELTAGFCLVVVMRAIDIAVALEPFDEMDDFPWRGHRYVACPSCFHIVVSSLNFTHSRTSTR